jgi:predicted DNA-binding WGR domain protein/cell wall assembly regulator SMI1
MRRFELVAGPSKKFWSIDVTGAVVTVQYGRFGTDGQNRKKEHASPADAKKAALTLIASKLKKGYVEAKAKRAASKKKATSKKKAASKKKATSKRAARTGLNAMLRELETALLKHYPQVHADLLAGASDGEVAKLSKLVKYALPADFEAVYRWHAGTAGDEFMGDWSMLSANEIVREYKSLRRDVPKSFHAAWLPFLRDLSGNVMFLDLEGIYDTPGNILCWDHEEPERPTAEYANTKVFVATLIAAAQKRAFDPSSARYETIRRRLNPGYPHRGEARLDELVQQMEAVWDDSDATVALSDEAIAISRTDERVWFMRWQGLVELDRYAEGLEASTEFIALQDPYDAVPWRIERALLLLALKRYRDTLREAEELIAGRRELHIDASRISKAWELVRDAHKGLGDKKEAHRAAKRALRGAQGPANELAWVWWEYAALEPDGKKKKAALRKTRTLFVEWVEDEQDDADSWYNRACLDALLGEFEAARQHLERAIDLDDTFAPKARKESDFASVRRKVWFRDLTS